jgi:hypothetical protein
MSGNTAVLYCITDFQTLKDIPSANITGNENGSWKKPYTIDKAGLTTDTSGEKLEG